MHEISGASGEQAETSLLAALSQELAEAVERAARAVVEVQARQRLPGSGVLWSADGLVVTADHVIEREEDITIGLPDEREVPARLVGRDPGSDLAVLRIDPPGLPAAEFGNPAAVRVGHLVLAVARPGTGAPMATAGIVSAVDGVVRTWRGGLIEGLIRADVTLYPGFSGGALADTAGRILGIATSGLSRGVSLALPVPVVNSTVQALLAHGRVQRAYLGVSSYPVPLPAPLVQRLGLQQGSGLLIVAVEPGSPAEQGGLLLGDIIISFGGQPTREPGDLQMALGPGRAGVATPVTIIRGGERRELTITPGVRR
jgi:S1-C subfamily serine protease